MSEEELPPTGQARIGWAYQVAHDTDRTEARFDAWAGRYDDDAVKLIGWRGPVTTGRMVKRYVATNARVLDAGSGTGLVGEILSNSGYGDIVAVDLSQSMLDVARTKNVYREIIKADLNKPLEFQDGCFDAVVSVGTSGYVAGNVVKEFVRVVRVGGYIIYTISDTHYREGGYQPVAKGLESSGVLEIVEVGPEFAAIPRAEPDHMARVHVLRKRACGRASAVGRI